MLTTQCDPKWTQNGPKSPWDYFFYNLVSKIRTSAAGTIRSRSRPSSKNNGTFTNIMPRILPSPPFPRDRYPLALSIYDSYITTSPAPCRRTSEKSGTTVVVRDKSGQIIGNYNGRIYTLLLFPVTFRRDRLLLQRIFCHLHI